MKDVMVNGNFVIEDGKLLLNARPGVAIRRAIHN